MGSNYMPGVTDLRDGFNDAQLRCAGQPYELEVGFTDPSIMAGSLMDANGVFPKKLMLAYYNEFRKTGKFQSSCGQVTGYLRDSILRGDWTKAIDNKMGTTGSYTTKGQCRDWFRANVLHKDGYFGVLLGCHSFTLAIFTGRVRLYQAYMALGVGGYNLTDCIKRDKEFSLSYFSNCLETVLMETGKVQQAAAEELFDGTCLPNANCKQEDHANLVVYELQPSFPNVKEISDRFIELKKSTDDAWSKAKTMTVMSCSLGIPSKIGRDKWTSDDYGKCEICNRNVGWGSRHHCRVCGKLICGQRSCLKNMKVLSSRRENETLVSAKVCSNCCPIDK
ncbi:FYVE zinc finger domain-containing protein [Sorangium sp. So ce388]|uniref:FYVE zinc finger domain-containing protein n=1 Tax=Sorangium sp. So ce388 TaxID=3133309 RepID=UPI003F5C85A4